MAPGSLSPCATICSMHRFFLAVLAGAVLASTQAQTIEFKKLNEEMLQERLRLANPQNSERYRILKNLFANSGCHDTVLREQKVKGSAEPNMICGVPGTGDHPRKIIVGAHFDCDGGD